MRTLAVAVEPVVVAVQRHRRDDRRVGVLEARLQRRIVHREGGERTQVPAGRSPGEEDLLRVTAVFVGVLVHPGDRSLDVDDLIGEGRVRAQPVVGLHTEPTAAREVVHDRQALLILLPVGPRAPVEVDQHRAVLRPRPREVEVELVPSRRRPRTARRRRARRRADAPRNGASASRSGETGRRTTGTRSGSTSCSKSSPRAALQRSSDRRARLRESGARARGRRPSPLRTARSRRCRAPNRAGRARRTRRAAPRSSPARPGAPRTEPVRPTQASQPTKSGRRGVNSARHVDSTLSTPNAKTMAAITTLPLRSALRHPAGTSTRPRRCDRASRRRCRP